MRGGFGVFYDTLNLRLISQVIRQNGANVLSYTITPVTAGAPIFPNLLSNPAGTLGKPNVTAFDPDFKQPRMYQANTHVKRELARDWSLTAGFPNYGGRYTPVLLDADLGSTGNAGRNDTPGYGFLTRRERYRLELIGEAENLLNSLNAACSTAGCTGAVVNTFNAPDFKRITSATDSRQIQLGGRIRF